jgi:excisionase family DNA binding protein
MVALARVSFRELGNSEMNQAFVEKRRAAITLNLITEEEVAKRLNVSVASLRRWRLLKKGPVFIKIGSLVRYRPEDLDSWLAVLPKGGNSEPSSQV